MSRALVFSGQGVHRKGMCLDLVRSSPAVAGLWERMKSCMMQNYGLPFQDIMQENPAKILVREDGFDESVFQRSCKDISNTAESAERTKIIVHPDGVMALTCFTQPCVVAAQLIALETLKAVHHFELEQFGTVAGHSLGEFTALTSLGAFSAETALNLTFRRGLLMENAFVAGARDRYRMYACNPSRAKLGNTPEEADDAFFVCVELVGRALAGTTSFVEVANYNIEHEQYVVAGDTVALSALGKCLDPQFRANCPSQSLDRIVREAVKSVEVDQRDGITMNPNANVNVDFVTSAFRKYGSKSSFRRFMRGPDDGFTPSLDQLSHLTLQEDGRSGLKKKSWYIPLTVEIPFHTSRLRRCMDSFLPIVRDALPGEAELRHLLSIDAQGNLVTGSRRPIWITNLTGTAFDPFSDSFRADFAEITDALNIGEVPHKGLYTSDLVKETFENGVESKSVVEICAAVLAAQMARPVLWVDVMKSMVADHKCTKVLEISPAKNACEMFRRSTFLTADQGKIPVEVQCFPADKNLFTKIN